MIPSAEWVTLVDDDGVATGSMLKSDVHGVDTPLHLAFSCYITDAQGRLLMTRRALTKQTWPGVWTNSVCGHPAPGEEIAVAINRRVHQELGASVSDITLRLPTFRYRATDASGIVENEICPVYTATLTSPLAPTPTEVSGWAWVSPAALIDAARAAPFAFSPWLLEQLPLLSHTGAFGGESRS